MSNVKFYKVFTILDNKNYTTAESELRDQVCSCHATLQLSQKYETKSVAAR